MKIFWAGDSTVKQNDISSYPQTGIGQGMLLYVKKDIQIRNFAENGRSTKSFIDENRLDMIQKEIGAGDMLFIQFGHNDEKPDEERHTDPDTTFKENLRKFIKVARDASAYPVLITPLYRRIFVSEHELTKDTHGEYPRAIKEVGDELNVPVIDLCEISRQFIAKCGDEPSKRYFMHLAEKEYPNFPEGKKDNTHLRYEGAVESAGMIASELNTLSGIYSDILVENKGFDEREKWLLKD